MPLFRVQLVYEFAGNGSEKAPAELLGEDGRVIKPLAQWPKAPLEVVAIDENAAVDQAMRQQRAAGTIFIDLRIGEAVFQALKARAQPGSGGKHSSVVEIWITRREGEADWHAHYVPLGPPSAG